MPETPGRAQLYAPGEEWIPTPRLRSVPPPPDAHILRGVPRLQYESFYHPWVGHEVAHLKSLVNGLRSRGLERPMIYLCGDSCLDNKAWVGCCTDACNGYEHVMSPPLVKPDVAYWINRLAYEEAKAAGELTARGTSKPTVPACINCAAEGTTLEARLGWFGGLLPQDEFARTRLGSRDVLVVCVGSLDIALAPSLAGALSAWALSWQGADAIAYGTAAGLGHFETLFRDTMQEYVTQVRMMSS